MAGRLKTAQKKSPRGLLTRGFVASVQMFSHVGRARSQLLTLGTFRHFRSFWSIRAVQTYGSTMLNLERLHVGVFV